MRIKFIFFSLVISIILIVAKPAQAHQPNYIDSQKAITVNEAEVSKAYYGELTGQPATFTITSQNDFQLYVGLLIPDLTGASQNYSVKIIEASDNLISDLNGEKFSWTRWYEEYAGDWYYQGPEFKSQVPAGIYKIIVSNPTNSGKYVLAIGEAESFPASQMLTTINQLYQMKTAFFLKPWYAIYQGKIGAYLLAGSGILLLIILVLLILVFKKRRQLFRGNKSKTMKKTLILAIFILFLPGCTTSNNQTTQPAQLNQEAGTDITTTISDNPILKLKTGKWINAHEEDKDGIMTYKNDPSYTPPPSRFRGYFVYQGNGRCSCLHVSPVDAHYEAPCSCSLTNINNEEIFSLDSSQYTVIKMTDKLLLLKLHLK